MLLLLLLLLLLQSVEMAAILFFPRAATQIAMCHSVKHHALVVDRCIFFFLCLMFTWGSAVCFSIAWCVKSGQEFSICKKQCWLGSCAAAHPNATNQLATSKQRYGAKHCPYRHTSVVLTWWCTEVSRAPPTMRLSVEWFPHHTM